MKFYKCAIVMVMVLLSGCGTTLVSNNISYSTHVTGVPKKVAVFLDGTANDLSSRTNISRLFELATNHDVNDVIAYYSEGVGTGGRVIGAGAGWGIGKDVRDAYIFIAQNYRGKQDKLFIFGFSRGSYTARILAGLIYVAGVVKLDTLPNHQREQFVTELYDAYKGIKDYPERMAAVQSVIDRWGVPTTREAKIEIMGLWDTIEALGLPNYEENVDEVNKRYVDQICNVAKAYHAVSLDDNRARIYTPILMTRRHLNKFCPEQSIDEKVEEVWFAGAHADVGGGYKEGNLSGVSLNWMIGKLNPTGLLPASARVSHDEYDVVHDAEGANVLYHYAFKMLSRHPEEYAKGSSYNQQRTKLHPSVISRLGSQKILVRQRINWRLNEFDKLKVHDSAWYLRESFRSCFKETAHGFDFIPEGCYSITIAEDTYQ